MGYWYYSNYMETIMTGIPYMMRQWFLNSYAVFYESDGDGVVRR